MATNYNTTDFNELQWNGDPFGENVENVNAIIEFQNGFFATVEISQINVGLNNEVRYNLNCINSNLTNLNKKAPIEANKLRYMGITSNQISNKLFEIKNFYKNGSNN